MEREVEQLLSILSQNAIFASIWNFELARFASEVLFTSQDFEQHKKVCAARWTIYFIIYIIHLWELQMLEMCNGITINHKALFELLYFSLLVALHLRWQRRKRHGNKHIKFDQILQVEERWCSRGFVHEIYEVFYACSIHDVKFKHDSFVRS